MTMEQSQTPSTQNLEKDLNELERKLVDLKVRYDQYFLGIEKVEPNKMREQAANIVKKYAGVPIQNTGHKFRYTTLVARYNSMTAYWNRVLREIEEGTYRREQFKQKLHGQAKGDAPPATASATDSKPAAAGKASANDPMAILYQQYMDARKNAGESTKGISKEVLEKQLKKQMQAIKEQYQCKRVTFKVVVEDGKAKIKALPKND